MVGEAFFHEPTPYGFVDVDRKLLMLIRKLPKKSICARTLIFICIIFFLETITACSASRFGNPKLSREMTELLNAKDYFTLETILNNNGSQLSETQKLYYKALLENRFNQTEQSLQTIDLLFYKHKKSLDEKTIAELLNHKSGNHTKQFEYKQAAEALRDMIELYGHLLDDFSREALTRDLQRLELLKNIPPQKIIRAKDTMIQFKINERGQITIPVVCNGVNGMFIFDTGANNSVISKSIATRMGIKLIDGSIQVRLATGNYIEAKLGVADNLNIGEILFKNIVFTIVDDEQLSLNNIHGIIGFNLMNQMKEIRIDFKKGNILFPVTPVKLDLRNLYLTGSTPVARLKSGLDTLLFQLDTGATQSIYTKKYFDAHRERIVNDGQRVATMNRSLGDEINSEGYVLTNVPFEVGNFEMTLPEILVETREYPMVKMRNFDGVLGQDVLTHFDEMILNFESMYLTFRKNSD